MSRSLLQDYCSAAQAGEEGRMELPEGEYVEAGEPCEMPEMPEKPVRSGSTGSGSCPVSTGMTVHEAGRAKKAVETSVKSIENRIKYFQREEEKIWRDLEEVRRQASTIEEGRTRTLEKKLADRTIQQERTLLLQQNRARAAANRSCGQDLKKRTQMQQDREKKLAAEDQRRTSQDILRQKRMQEAQTRLMNSERAAAIQRTQLESRLKANQERCTRLDRMREQHEAERQAAEQEVASAESRLPELEAQEMICLQRLQNSRIVTQSVLEELESSLGKNSAVTSLLRSKQKGQDHLSTASFGSIAGSGHLDGPHEEEEEEEPYTPEHEVSAKGLR